MATLTNSPAQKSYCLAKIRSNSLTIAPLTFMPSSITPKAHQGFDYASLDAPTSQFVQQQTGEIQALMKRTAQNIIEVGQKLIEVKNRLGHGYFLTWLQAEFGWSYPTAARFMQVANSFKETSQIENFAPSALYELAGASTPEAARNEAIARAKAGESITRQAAKSIKQKYVPPAAAPKSEPAPKLDVQPISQLSPTPQISLAQPRIKQEIIAIRPKPVAIALPTTDSSISLQAIPTPLLQVGTPSPMITTDVAGSWWQLVGKHLLYGGDPNSSQFLQQIPEQVSLLLAFPQQRDWQTAIKADVRVIITEHLPQCKDPNLLDEILEFNLLHHSKVGMVVVNCFVPSLEILSIVNRLGRRGLFAEPDAKRVNAVISDWKQAGLKVEKVR
ncbi:DUF3102 domain-containing protein [Synechocystis sp. PCC 7509]|uniref:DUF3102 domain-containing protein n=1 Tax=Synechocystis sp. PCC 7509 TaxID=927677 RepID=UPI0002ACE341|nr:DUF3102 domain-containing protein [Synechocystis sp. PCC 7509]